MVEVLKSSKLAFNVMLQVAALCFVSSCVQRSNHNIEDTQLEMNSRNNQDAASLPVIQSGPALYLNFPSLIGEIGEDTDYFSLEICQEDGRCHRKISSSMEEILFPVYKGSQTISIDSCSREGNCKEKTRFRNISYSKINNQILSEYNKTESELKLKLSNLRSELTAIREETPAKSQKMVRGLNRLLAMKDEQLQFAVSGSSYNAILNEGQLSTGYGVEERSVDNFSAGSSQSNENPAECLAVSWSGATALALGLSAPLGLAFFFASAVHNDLRFNKQNLEGGLNFGKNTLLSDQDLKFFNEDILKKSHPKHVGITIFRQPNRRILGFEVGRQTLTQPEINFNKLMLNEAFKSFSDELPDSISFNVHTSLGRHWETVVVDLRGFKKNNTSSISFEHWNFSKLFDHVGGQRVQLVQTLIKETLQEKYSDKFPKLKEAETFIFSKKNQVNLRETPFLRQGKNNCGVASAWISKMRAKGLSTEHIIDLGKGNPVDFKNEVIQPPGDFSNFRSKMLSDLNGSRPKEFVFKSYDSMDKIRWKTVDSVSSPDLAAKKWFSQKIRGSEMLQTTLKAGVYSALGIGIVAMIAGIYEKYSLTSDSDDSLKKRFCILQHIERDISRLTKKLNRLKLNSLDEDEEKRRG